MICLGHIPYANAFPVHGPLLLGDVPLRAEIVTGDPARLNRLLAAGRVQVAPCSSIEYARHYPRYRIIGDLAIASTGPVRSILLGGRREPEHLAGSRVGLPTASASSSSLAEILLSRRFGVEAEFGWFDQLREDPFERFDSALFIGDIALRVRQEREDLHWTDLGAAWTEWTGLPFVYALWQVHAPPALDAEIDACARALVESRARGLADLEGLAKRYPGAFPPGREELPSYWRDLSYELDGDAQEGLIAFYTLAVETGQLERVPSMRFVESASVPASR
jgi:chorismate dehydratase